MLKAKRPKVQRVGVRLSLEERDRLEDVGNQLNLSVSDVVRLAIDAYLKGPQAGPVSQLISGPIAASPSITDIPVGTPSGSEDRVALNPLGWDDDEDDKKE